MNHGFTSQKPFQEEIVPACSHLRRCLYTAKQLPCWGSQLGFILSQVKKKKIENDTQLVS